MGGDHRNGEQQLGDEIAVAYRVNAVLRESAEAQAALKKNARDREGASSDCSSAERKNSCGAGRSSDASPIALQRPEVLKHAVRSQDRLCALHVRVGGHKGIVERRRVIEHHLLQRSYGAVDLGAGVHYP